VKTITRDRVIALVDRAITETPSLTDAERRALTETALTIERIALNGWYSEEYDCGCVSTTAFNTLTEDPRDLISPAVRRFGLEFDRYLRDEVGEPEIQDISAVEVEG